MGCDRQRKMWRASVVPVMLVAAVLMGCDAPMDKMVTVQVVVKGGEGVDTVQCADQDTGGMLASMRGELAAKAGKECYDIELFDGAMLSVGLRTQGKDRRREMSFPLIYDGRQKKLLFSRGEFTASLNGQVVFVDLADPKAVDWVRRQSAQTLQSIRTIRPSGKADTDRLALEPLAGSGVLIFPPAGFFARITPGVLKALVAVKPVGVVAEDGSVPAELSDLTHLALGGAKVGDLKPFGKLKYFQFAFRNAEKPDLKPLAVLTQLKCLVLVKCKGVTDFQAIAKLKGLRSLVLNECNQMKDVSAIRDNAGLQTLVLFECEQLRDLSPLAKLRQLRYLTIGPVHESANLKPLGQLKKLKVLMVDKDSLKKRKADYDDLRKALPDTEIIGFCMGSLWILAVVPASIVGGWLWRRRRRSRKPPQ